MQTLMHHIRHKNKFPAHFQQIQITVRHRLYFVTENNNNWQKDTMPLLPPHPELILLTLKKNYVVRNKEIRVLYNTYI